MDPAERSTSTSTSARWRTAGLLAASFLLAASPLAALAWLSRPPAEVVAASVRLTGSWRLQESAADGLGALEVDDRAWPMVRLPGAPARQGFAAKDQWLRRSFSWSGPTGEPLFLFLGNLRNGLAELFVNGVYVGRDASDSYGYQPDWTHLAGWEIPPHLVRAGENLIALRIHWHQTEAAGFAEGRMFVGPARIVAPFASRTQRASQVFSYGSIFLCAFLVVLMAILIRATSDAVTRKRLWAALFVVVGAAYYGLCVTGVFGLFLPWPEWLAAAIPASAISAATMSTWHLVELQFLGRVTLGQRADRFLSPAFAVGAALYPPVFRVQAAWIGGFLVYMMGIAVRGAVRTPRGTVPLTAFALLALFVTAVLDMIGTFGLSETPSLFSQSLSDMGLVVSVSLVTEFIQISRRNEVLSASLTVTNAELAGALARAEESTRLKGELLATVSHELRTPLNSLVNVPQGVLESFSRVSQVTCSRCAQAFQLEPGDPPVSEQTACPECATKGSLSTSTRVKFEGDAERAVRYLEMMGASGQHLLGLVDDLLDYSRLNASQLELRLSPVALAPFCREVKSTVEPLAREQALAVEFPATFPEKTLRADPERLRQVMLHLLRNAIKFSPRGGGAVRLEVRDEGAQCALRVIDQGIGIAPEHQQLIFEGFRQADSGHTRRFGGVGLGLSLSRELAALHGGTVTVESQLGAGSAFTVRLPWEGPRAQS